MDVLGDDDLYNGNVVSELQIAIARWSDEYIAGFDPILAQCRADGKLGTLNIKSAIVGWAFPGVEFVGAGFTITNTTPFTQVRELTGIKFIGNGDSMFHVNKGYFGIRMNSVRCVKISTDIKKVINKGDCGSELPGRYWGATDGGHLDQSATMYGYMGADTYGIHLSACEDVYILCTSIKCIHSKNGSSYGLSVMGDCYDIKVKDTRMHCISSNAQYPKHMPNKFPYAVGAFVDESSKATIFKECVIDKVKAKYVAYAGHNYIIDNNDTIIN
jgi:hypothetical protein